jgi:hypothetical protein
LTVESGTCKSPENLPQILAKPSFEYAMRYFLTQFCAGLFSASQVRGVTSISEGNYSFVHSFQSTVSGLRSAVLGGQNINATEDDTVYMPKVELDETGQGIIMKSPDGTRYKITIANGGTLSIVLA